ncbi:MAG: phenylacetate--CoA ligase family protein [Planctomycetes bacterium]|nr:phenylacetate--CoA ligase family protein [Planctomycetota bacterium]
MTESPPRLRAGVECVAFSQRGLDGKPFRWNFVIDYRTGRRFAVSNLEAEIFAAVRRCGAEATPDRVRHEVRVGSGLTASDEAIEGLVASLSRLCLLAEPEESAEPLGPRQGTNDRETYESLQRDALSAFFERVVGEVPYYRDLLGDQEPPTSAGDLSRFPIMNKAALRAALPKLQPDWLTEEKHSVRFLSSSGSTDDRTQTLHLTDELSQPYSMGFSALGLNPATDEFTIAYLIPPICSGTECHMDMMLPYTRRVTPSGRLLYLNSFRDPSTVSDERVDAVLDELEGFAPSMLAFDAAYAAPVARRALATGRRLPSVKAIITSYGVSSSLHLDLLKKAFGVPVHDMYSMTEAGPIAGSCAEGAYHVFSPCLVEIVDEEGSPVAPGEVGRLLVTTLENKLTPLLRYETGDFARAAVDRCSCSLEHTDTFASLEGRISDAITDTRGGRVVARAVDTAVAADLVDGALQCYQLVQGADRGYRLLVVPGEAYDADVEAALADRLRGLLGGDAALAIESCRSLPPSTNGKYRLCYRER